MKTKPYLICRVLNSQAIYVEITVMWDDKSSTLVEVYRRYVAFVYLYETAHRHVAEGSNFYRRNRNDVMSV